MDHKYLPINSLMCDQVMTNTCQKYDIDPPNTYHNPLLVGKFLERMENNIAMMEKGTEPPPIKVKEKVLYVPPHERGLDRKKSKTLYKIVQGRHRVVASMIFQRELIQAEIIE